MDCHCRTGRLGGGLLGPKKLAVGSGPSVEVNRSVLVGNKIYLQEHHVTHREAMLLQGIFDSLQCTSGLGLLWT